MTTFSNAVTNQSARTQNGMLARKSTANKCVDLFFKIGASRGKDIIPDFVGAYIENNDYALRIAAWVRDIRGGAGERKLFRDILLYLENTNIDECKKLAFKAPELGRWDDLLIFKTPEMKNYAYSLISSAIKEGNGLTCKWCPRKGVIANELRKFMGLTPKQYRKTLVQLTRVVETKMCSNNWDNINFSQVPSIASSRYKKAFNRHTDKYREYVEKLMNGDTDVKVNASSIYPYEVVSGLSSHSRYDITESNLIISQWNALPDYINSCNILPMVDVSGSMNCPAGNSKTISCMDVAISLGIYTADKNKGSFKDLFLTFSAAPDLIKLTGNVVQKYQQMIRANWNMNTNLIAAFDKILSVAIEGNVKQSEMPEMLLILSDMQFDRCARFDDTAFGMIQRKYNDAGYIVPKIVFWNINSFDNAPVKFDQSGVALVSGFSPAIFKSLLAGNIENFTPENIMLETIMNDRYAVI